MASCASKLQGKISCLEQVISNYHYEYWLLKNILLEIGEEEGLIDEQWEVVERSVVTCELPTGSPLPQYAEKADYLQALKGDGKH